MRTRHLLLCAVAAVAVLISVPANADGAGRERPLACGFGAVTGAIGGYAAFTGAIAVAIGPPTLAASLAATAVGGLAGCWIFAAALNAMAELAQETVNR